MGVQKQLRNRRKHSHIVPYQQGKLDSLCGIYSIINALLWVVNEKKQLSKYRAVCLMENAAEYLSSKKLLSDTLLYGMNNEMWRRLTYHSVEFAEEHYGLRFDICPLDQSLSYMKTIKSHLDDDKVILTHIRGAHKHFTVITGYNDHSWILFDSDGMSYIRQSSIKASFQKKDSRYSFTKNGLIALQKK